jgi:hypothetical protein
MPISTQAVSLPRLTKISFSSAYTKPCEKTKKKKKPNHKRKKENREQIIATQATPQQPEQAMPAGGSVRMQ